MTEEQEVIIDLEIKVEKLQEELKEARKLLAGLWGGNNDHTCIMRFFRKYP